MVTNNFLATATVQSEQLIQIMINIGVGIIIAWILYLIISAINDGIKKIKL